MNSAAIDDAICTLLRGKAFVWPFGHGADACREFLARADYHGVAALLNEHISELTECPAAIREALHSRAIASAFWDLQHREVLGRVLGVLSEQDIRPVLFKGTALAYDLYEAPGLRVRADTDAIIAFSDAQRTGELISASGFTLAHSAGGDVASSQASYIREDNRFGNHTIDLHWQISNSALLSVLFTYEELRASATPLPSLHTDALAAGPLHALLLACLHRAVHRQIPYYVDGVAYYGGDRLVWLYDILLLARTLTDLQWQELITQASKKGLCSTCLGGLQDTTDRLGLVIPDFVRQRLNVADETVDAYLSAGLMRQHWLDFWSIQSSEKKLAFARELIFPPRSYMRAKYAGARVDWLPWLYLRRAVEGSLKRLNLAG